MVGEVEELEPTSSGFGERSDPYNDPSNQSNLTSKVHAPTALPLHHLSMENIYSSG